MLSFIEWCEATWLGTVVRESLWAFPVLEAIHLIGLALLGGALLIVDLRMLGLGLHRQSVAELAHDAKPWLVAALVVMVLTGVPLFLSEATKAYYSTAFRVKISALPFALAWTFLVRARIARGETGQGVTVRSRFVGALSMLLWFTVAAAGRWIGFS